MIDAVHDQSLLALVYGYGSRSEFAQWYAGYVRDRGEEIVCGITEIFGLRGIREGYQALASCLDWAISLGDGTLISWPQVTETQTEICVYPIDLESQMKTAVCAGELARIKKTAERFQNYLLHGPYSPGEIKGSCVRFLWALLNVAKEVGYIDTRELDQRDILDQVMGAKTLGQLRRPFRDVLSRIRIVPTEMEGASLAVKKAQSMIREFYAEGITLNEIAGRLNMSQEYLGAQFHKEVGEPFSVYIRNVRMSKAKELLIGTQLKQYEIALRVGYADAKYFARVFRECEGMSPAEYRKSYR